MKKAVIGIIFDADRTKVLIIKRRDVAVWVLPGGGVERDETPEQAILREIEEETGCQAIIIRKVGEYTPLNRLASFTDVYECGIVSGTPQTGPETKDFMFVHVNRLPNSFFPVHEDWLRDALENCSVIKKPIWRVTYFQVIKYFFLHPIRFIRFALSLMGFPINS